jgi:hypothetical protein
MTYTHSEKVRLFEFQRGISKPKAQIYSKLPLKCELAFEFHAAYFLQFVSDDPDAAMIFCFFLSCKKVTLASSS